jgi:CRP-like cAMP-binding protein
MHNLLRTNIEKTINQKISDTEFQQFLQFLQSKKFDKKHRLIEEGQTCEYIYFVEQGSCYSYMTDDSGEKHAIQFALEAYWISDLYSFFSTQKAVYTIESLEPIKVLALHRNDFQKACDTIFLHALIGSLGYLCKTLMSLSPMTDMARTNSDDAEKDIPRLSKKHSDFLQRIPNI